MGDLLVESSAREQVCLNQVAQLSVERGPEVVSRESAQRRIIVQANLRGRDLGSFVKRSAGADQRLADGTRRL